MSLQMIAKPAADDRDDLQGVDGPTAVAAARRCEELEALLQRRLGNRVRDLHVVFIPSGVVLQGWTSTYHAKQLAQHAAMELCDLPVAANDIEVR